jgi:hypothetical protein
LAGLKDPPQYKHRQNYFPLWPLSTLLDYDFNRPEAALSCSFHVNLGFSGPVVLENDPTLFLYDYDYISFEKGLTILNSLYPRMICTKFG